MHLSFGASHHMMGVACCCVRARPPLSVDNTCGNARVCARARVCAQAMSTAFGAFRSANTGEQEDAQEYLAFFLDQVRHPATTKIRRNPYGTVLGSHVVADGHVPTWR